MISWAPGAMAGLGMRSNSTTTLGMLVARCWSMNLVVIAREDPQSRRWRWTIVDVEGPEVSASVDDYDSVGEALEAGRARLRQYTQRTA